MAPKQIDIHVFNISTQKCNMKISTDMTKYMVASKNSLRWELLVNSKITEQVMEFKYL